MSARAAALLVSVSLMGQQLPHVANLRAERSQIITLVPRSLSTQPLPLSGNIAGDFSGPVDTRPGTYGTAEASSTPLVFAPPAGFLVHVDRILGDVVAWPTAGCVQGVPPSGVLAGFQVNVPPDAPTCNLCAANTPMYVQAAVPPAGATRVFDYPIGLTLTDNTLTVVLASWLNSYGGAVHIEITYTIRYRLVKVQQQQNEKGDSE